MRKRRVSKAVKNHKTVDVIMMCLQNRRHKHVTINLLNLHVTPRPGSVDP